MSHMKVTCWLKLSFLFFCLVDASADQLAAYRKALAIDPHFAPARFIGRVLINKGQLEAGIKEMKRAVRDANHIEAENYGNDLIGILKAHNRRREAEEIKSSSKLKLSDLKVILTAGS